MRPPERIGRYRVQSIIGAGGFAVVFRAYDEALDDSVAIKILAENWMADPEIRERFLEEARMLRRIRSDHLVTVHDVGELDGDQPYFVMEFAKRGSLADRLKSREGTGLDPASARKLVSALAEGVGALHAAGIVHRDVNPRNLFLQAQDSGTPRRERSARVTQLHAGLIAADERVLLGDLGLAKDVVRTGGAASVIGGTPHYHAPEQLDRGAPVRPAADIFAATGVVWEAITGDPPPHPAELERALPAVDGRWHEFFRCGLATDPDDRFEDMYGWREAVLGSLGPGVAQAEQQAVTQPKALTATGPYKGLAAFQVEDATRFFGRDALVGELLDRLARARTLMVGGPSGSGKSSLVRAGLIPAVAAGGLPGSERWPVALLTPRADPIAELAYQLARTSRSATQQHHPVVGADQLRADPLHARLAAETITDTAGGLLLVIDQFEELFTQCGNRDEQERFLDVLAAMVDQAGSRVHLVMAMRADFYGTSALFPWLAQQITRNQVLVGPMTRSELRQAIEEPARQAGLRLEDGLVDAILEEGGSEPGSLPLVSHALAETWRRRRGTTLTLAGFRDAGGVAGALAQTADALHTDRFDEAQRQAARRLLLRLVTPGEGTPDTRRPLALEELDHDSEPETITEVAAELTHARLLTVDRDTVEIAHEALIHSWPRFRGWIEEAREDLRVRQRIDRAGAEWVAQDREPDLLYRGTALQTALEWTAQHGEELSPPGRELVETSEAAWEEAERRRRLAERRSRRIRRAAVAGLGALTAVAIAASFMAYSAAGQAESRLAQALATQALGLVGDDPRLALALAVESMERGDRPSLEARTALVESNQTLETANFAPAGAPVTVGDALSVATRPDGEVVATGTRDGTIGVWDAATGEALGDPLEGHAGAVQGLDFSPDGRWLLTSGDDGTVRRWDFDDPADVPPPETLGSADGLVWQVAVSPEGSVAATGSVDGTVRLWDLDAGQPLEPPLVQEDRSIDRVAFNADGTLLVGVTSRGELGGWRLPEGEQVLEWFSAHDGPVWGVEFAPSGEMFATASADGRVRLWDAASGDLVDEPFPGADVRGPQFSADGRLLLAGDRDGRLRVWDVDAGEEHAALGTGHDARILATSVSAAGDVLATLAMDQTLRIWTAVADPMGLVLDGHEGGAFGVAVSPAGDLVATGDGHGGLRLFDSRSGDLRLGPLTAHDDAVGALAFNDDATLLASGSDDGEVAVHDVRTGEAVARVQGHDGVVTVAVFDGDRLFTGGGDGLVQAWSTDGRSAGQPLGPHDGRVTGLALGPEDTLAVTDELGNVRVWQPDDRTPVGTSIPPAGDTLWDLAWSGDRTLLATAGADETVTLWDVRQGRSTASLTRHPQGATGVDFLSDGATLVTAARDGTVRLWDVALGRPVGEPLTAHADTVWQVVAHPDGSRFATSSEDGTVRVWDVLDPELACERAAGAFDDEQRRRYLGEGEPAAGCR